MKTKLITLTLTAVLAAALVSLTACGSSDTASVAESATSKTASTATSDATSATTANSETDTESAAESTAEATTQTATEQPVAQPEKPVQTNTGTVAQQPQTTTSAAPTPQTHAPIYRQQWVVDKAAWTEEIPVYEQQVYDACNGCGLDITDNPAAHIKEQMLAGNMKCSGHHTAIRKIQTGTKTIQHEEQGHYENVLICAGCTGTH